MGSPGKGEISGAFCLPALPAALGLPAEAAWGVDASKTADIPDFVSSAELAGSSEGSKKTRTVYHSKTVITMLTHGLIDNFPWQRKKRVTGLLYTMGSKSQDFS